MQQVKTRIGPGGRVVIPAEFRRRLGIETGDEVAVVLDDDGLHVWTAAEGLRRVRALVKDRVPKGRSLAAELIEDRRREAARE